MRRHDALQVRLPAKTPRVSILSGHADTIHTDLGQATRLNGRNKAGARFTVLRSVQCKGKERENSPAKCSSKCEFNAEACNQLVTIQKQGTRSKATAISPKGNMQGPSIGADCNTWFCRNGTLQTQASC